MAQENDPRHVVTNSHNISSDVFFDLFFSFFGSVDFSWIVGSVDFVSQTRCNQSSLAEHDKLHAHCWKSWFDQESA